MKLIILSFIPNQCGILDTQNLKLACDHLHIGTNEEQKS